MTQAIQRATRNLWTITQSGVRNVKDDIESFRVALYENSGVFSNGSVIVSDDFIRGSIQSWNAFLKALNTETPEPYQFRFDRALKQLLLAVREGLGDTGTIPNQVISAYNTYLAS